MILQSMHERCDFHEVGASASNEDDFVFTCFQLILHMFSGQTKQGDVKQRGFYSTRNSGSYQRTVYEILNFEPFRLSPLDQEEFRREISEHLPGTIPYI